MSEKLFDEKPAWEKDGFKDDGSLACLGLGTDRDRKAFSCPVITQSELVGKTFYIVDAFTDIDLKGVTKCLYKMKFSLDESEESARKVWTGSQECMRILKVLLENDLLPRKVTLLAGKKGSFRFQ